MSRENRPFLLFEDTLKGESFYFSDPVEEVIAHELSEVASALNQIEELRSRGLYVAGFVSYEAGYSFFPLQSKPLAVSQTPLLHFYAFTDKQDGRPSELEKENIQNAAPLFNFQWDTSREKYESLQNQIREHLLCGDIYQQNQTMQMSFSCAHEATTLYQNLRKEQKTHYSAFFNFPQYQILSFSPELFYKKSGENIYVEPMKGTLPASQDAHILKNDEKNISENLMIVDLLRNDLGKMARPGSVMVDELFRVQTLETVHQMTSRISAKIETHTSVHTLFRSLFPCGSITGAPKWSAMQLIRQQEVSPRGVYTGAMGYVEPNNDQCFNVAIRTLVAKENRFSMGLGGGIVVDSEVSSEYHEALLKSRFVRKLNRNFYLIETFLFDGRSCRDLSLHLQRMQNSAEKFGFEMNDVEVERAILVKVQNLTGEHKMRLTLNFDGEFQVESQKLTALSSILSVALSSQKIQSQDVFRQHKTSKREIYDSEFERAQKEGLYDVLFLNEKGEIAEASRHNVFIKKDHVWKTPSLSSGALPGIARARALKEFQAQESVISLEDIRVADEIILTNSARGFVSVKWREL